MQAALTGCKPGPAQAVTRLQLRPLSFGLRKAIQDVGGPPRLAWLRLLI